MQSSCPFCAATHLYTLSSGQLKCARCRKRFRPQRSAMQARFVHAFLDCSNASSVAKMLSISYGAAHRHCSALRRMIALHLQQRYFAHQAAFTQYEEFVYVGCKASKARTIDPGACIDLLAFSDGEHVYTLPLPGTRAKELYTTTLLAYLKSYKLRSERFANPHIRAFGEYVQDFMRAFPGVRREHFFWYLKEAEFRFCTPAAEQEEILLRLVQADAKHQGS